jgi:Flp pilus assembly protein TadD
LAEAEEIIELQQEGATASLSPQETEKEAQRTNGRFDRAIATLNKALAIQADNLPAMMHLAKMYLVKAVSQSQAQLFALPSTSDSVAGTAVSAGPTSMSQNQQQQQGSVPPSHTRQTAEGDVALCEALLNGAIEGVAWNCTEAYAMRAECRRLRGDEVGEREDLIRALEREMGRGLRGWEVVRDWI